METIQKGIYVIMNKRNKKYITGTDYRYFPRRQILSENIEEAMIFKEIFDSEEIEARFSSIATEIKKRRINLKNYKIIKVGIKLMEAE